MRRIWLGRWHHEVFCCSGSENSCHNLRLLESHDREIQGRALVEATRQINHILAELRKQAPAGRRLALVDSGQGLLLTWIEPLESPPPDISEYVSIESPQEEIVRFLGLERS